MPEFILAFVPGGTFFFTVTWLKHREKLLAEHIDDFGLGSRRPVNDDRALSMPWSFCPITCIASGRFLPGTRISPLDGMTSKRDLQRKFPEGRDAKGGMRCTFPPYGPQEKAGIGNTRTPSKK
jgi:hypothetical protein